MSFAYQIAEVDGRRAVTVFYDGEVFQASDDRPDFDALVEKARAGDASVLEMFDPATTITKRFVRLTDRVTLRNGQVCFDGDPLDDSVTKAIVSAIEEGTDDWAPLVNFIEKLYQNPNEHSRKQLYRWLATHKFTIAADGDVLGYKQVRMDGLSQHSGFAIVDDVEVNGNVPNKVGSIIEMPRSKVTFDPSVGCSYGLHVGTWDYASTFMSGGQMLLIKFNPRDVVSVPTDSSDQKVRVCRYRVVSSAPQKDDRTIAWDYDDDEVGIDLAWSVAPESLVE